MRVLFTLALLAATTPLLPAAEPAAEARARAALALALAQAPAPPQAPDVTPAARTLTKGVNCGEYACPSNGGRGCSCGPDCPCINVSPSKRSLTYADARPQAAREGKALVVWVGTSCPACERELTDLLHVHVRTFPGAVAPCVVVGRPEGGELWRTDLPGQPTVEAIRRAAAAPAASAPAAAPAFYQSSSYQPALPLYQAGMTGFGEWRGGFGGGMACGPRG